jgi:hypothetical protein
MTHVMYAQHGSDSATPVLQHIVVPDDDHSRSATPQQHHPSDLMSYIIPVHAHMSPPPDRFGSHWSRPPSPMAKWAKQQGSPALVWIVSKRMQLAAALIGLVTLCCVVFIFSMEDSMVVTPTKSPLNEAILSRGRVTSHLPLQTMFHRLAPTHVPAEPQEAFVTAVFPKAQGASPSNPPESLGLLGRASAKVEEGGSKLKAAIEKLRRKAAAVVGAAPINPEEEDAASEAAITSPKANASTPEMQVQANAAGVLHA